MIVSKREYEIGGILRNTNKDFFDKLTYNEYRVLELKYGLKDKKYRSLDDLSKILNITRERVHQIEEKALLKLNI